MPVVSTQNTTMQVVYTLASLAFTFQPLGCLVRLQCTVNGTPTTQFEFQIDPATLAAMLAAAPAGATREADMKAAIYGYAIANNILSGTIQ